MDQPLSRDGFSPRWSPIPPSQLLHHLHHLPSAFIRERNTCSIQINKPHFLDRSFINKSTAEVNNLMIRLITQTTVNPLPIYKHGHARIRFGMIRKHYPELLIGCAGNITFACRRDRFPGAIRGIFGLAYCSISLSQSINAGSVTDIIFAETSRFWLGHAQDYNFEVAYRGHRE